MLVKDGGDWNGSAADICLCRDHGQCLICHPHLCTKILQNNICNLRALYLHYYIIALALTWWCGWCLWILLVPISGRVFCIYLSHWHMERNHSWSWSEKQKAFSSFTISVLLHLSSMSRSSSTSIKTITLTSKYLLKITIHGTSCHAVTNVTRVSHRSRWSRDMANGRGCGGGEALTTTVTATPQPPAAAAWPVELSTKFHKFSQCSEKHLWAPMGIFLVQSIFTCKKLYKTGTGVLLLWVHLKLGHLSAELIANGWFG